MSESGTVPARDQDPERDGTQTEPEGPETAEGRVSGSLGAARSSESGGLGDADSEGAGVEGESGGRSDVEGGEGESGAEGVS